MLVDLVLIAVVLVYVVQTAWLVMGVRRRDSSSSAEALEPMVSVIVAARNEEADIPACLESLMALEYPAEKLEIVIVDDQSVDETSAVVQRIRNGDKRVKLLRSEAAPGFPRGKANALARGIRQSKGDVLVFTDADCIVPKTWVQSIVRQYSGDVGIVAGFTLLPDSSAFKGMQALDWIYLFSVASGTAGWGLPLTAIGNNLSIKREAYDAIGGFENIPFSVTEDYMLVQSILQRTDFTLKFPPDAGMVVRSRACDSVKQLFRQKQRWGVGGMDMIPRGLLIMGIGWLTKLLLLIGLFVASTSVVALTILAKLLADAALLSVPLGSFCQRRYLRHFALFELYFWFYVLLLPVVAFLSSKHVQWKGRNLVRRSKQNRPHEEA